MNQKLILGGMNQKLIDAEKDNKFYCNNCKNEFDHIISFYPIPGLTEYYTCNFCKDLGIVFSSYHSQTHLLDTAISIKF